MTRRLTAVLLLLVSTGCSRKKTLTSDDLKSQLTQAISFAAEEEMFVDYVRAGRATSNFAEQHAAYLDAEIQRSADELAKVVPQSGTQSCRVRFCMISRNPVIGGTYSRLNLAMLKTPTGLFDLQDSRLDEFRNDGVLKRRPQKKTRR